MEKKTYDYWRQALKGNFGPVHDGDPQPGFYRLKAKEGPDKPVAIWQGPNGVMFALVGKAAVDPDRIWIYCCNKPIPESLYRQVVEEGKPWPEDLAPLPDATARIGDNNAPADEAEIDEVEAAINAAEAELRNPVTTQVAADRLGNHIERLRGLWKKKEAERNVEKAPHLEASRAVDEKFRPILARLDETAQKIKDAIGAWLKAENARIQAEAAAAKKKADDERAAAAAKGEELPKEPPKKVTEPKAATAGSNRKVSLRTYVSATVTDWEKLTEALKDHEEVRALLQTLADRAARAGVPLPGTEINKEQRAA